MKGSWTIGHAQRVFWRYTSPRILLAAVLLAVPARLLAGQWHWSHALIPLVLVAVHPFTEWIIHVVLLHWRPRKVGPLTLDFVASRDHRAHHRDPEHLPLVFIPLPTLLLSLVLVPAAWLLLSPTLPFALTGLAATSCIALFYEWTHFACHVPLAPKTRWWKQRVKHHRLHHYKNEHYWYGVSMHLGDKVLRTAPEPGSIERSPTARMLHPET